MTPPRRVAVIVLDYGRPEDAEAAALSAREGDMDVRVLIVDNGSPQGRPPAEGRLRLPANRGFAGGMNAGIERLKAEGCDLFLLLNNDAVLESGSLRLMAAALEDPRLGAVGPVILQGATGRVESRGIALDLRTGRVRLMGQGEVPGGGGGVVAVEALSGAVLLMSRAALEGVGLLDEEYFFSFEDLDWCVRARRAGFALGVVLGARARHEGGRTLGRTSPQRLYYASRNHVRFVEKLLPRGAPLRSLRRLGVLLLNLSFALRQREIPRLRALGAAAKGFWDGCRRRTGPCS